MILNKELSTLGSGISRVHMGKMVLINVYSIYITFSPPIYPRESGERLHEDRVFESISLQLHWMLEHIKEESGLRESFFLAIVPPPGLLLNL